MELERQYDDEIEIDLREVFGVLAAKWWIIVISAFLGGALAVLFTVKLITPKYESTAMLYLVNSSTSETSLADVQMGTELTADFEIIAKSKPVIDGAINRIENKYKVKFTRDQIEKMLNVQTHSRTRILLISAISENAIDACRVVNAVAEELSERMASITKTEPPTIVEEAEVADTPVSPDFGKNISIGMLIGFFCSCVALLLSLFFNDNIKTEVDVEKYMELPTLVVIPYIKDREKQLYYRRKKVNARKAKARKARAQNNNDNIKTL